MIRAAPLRSVDPTTLELIQEYAEHDAARLEDLLATVHLAASAWRRVPPARRAESLRAMATLLREEADPSARLMAREMGKPVAQGRAEVEKCAWVCEHYAEHGEALLRDEDVATGGRSYVAYRPLGVVLAVMPWNFPFWQVFRAAAPALMAGNTVLLKHASNVSGCALAIEGIVRAASGRALLRAALVRSSRVGVLIDDPRVRAVTLTGSVAAGRAVAQRAGAALKPSVLELGGSDPYLILADAHLPAALDACAASRLINSGQSCIAAKRFIVVDAVREAFEVGLVERLRRARVGDPHAEDTDVGPLARPDLCAELSRQVDESVRLGAEVLLPSRRLERGAYFAPAVLTDVGPGMPAYEEELFGPVAAVIPVADEAAAVRVANDSSFGLGAAVFTADAERGERIARDELEAGCCFVNDHVRSDPRLPFGGVKDSGYGRELGPFGLRAFTNVKTVCVYRERRSP